MRVIALANQKGGVGKTTSAVNLAAGLAQLGHKSIVIDCDPQANASTALGFFESDISDPFMDTCYRLFSDSAKLEDVAIPTQFPGLSIVRGTKHLVGIEIELVSFEDRESRLRVSMNASSTDAEFVIIDTPPSLGLLTLNCLVAADEVIIPVQCEFLSLSGLARLLNIVRAVQKGDNPYLKVCGVLATMFDSRTKLSREVTNDLANHFPDLLFSTVVPRSVKMAEAPSYGLPIVEYAPSSAGAKAYMSLTREVLEK